MAEAPIKILLVEDDEDDYVITRGLLSEIEGFSYELKWIKTYDEALQEIKGWDYDLYLLDYRLGEQTGLDVLKEAVKAECQAPIILMSGQGAREVDMMAMKAGASDYLVKGTFDAVHLERAIRYAIERKRTDAELKALYQALLKMSRQAGMAEVASGILHNVGNILTSINVSTHALKNIVRSSKTYRLAGVAALLSEHHEDLADFLTDDEKGKQLPAYLRLLSEHLMREQNAIQNELDSLVDAIDHVKHIVAMQNEIGGSETFVETVSVQEVLEEAMRMCERIPEVQGIRVHREYAPIGPLRVQKHELIQILMNLVRNAAQALAAGGVEEKRLTLTLAEDGKTRIRIQVADNGIGISEQDRVCIFAQGYTTKKGGRGLGLHHSALVAKQLGGHLSVYSEGPNLGAVFTLLLPLCPPEN